MKYYIDLLVNDPDLKNRFGVLPNKKVVKHTNLIKCLFYLLEFDKDQICVEDSQMFFWKKARHLWNDELV